MTREPVMGSRRIILSQNCVVITIRKTEKKNNYRDGPIGSQPCVNEFNDLLGQNSISRLRSSRRLNFGGNGGAAKIACTDWLSDTVKRGSDLRGISQFPYSDSRAHTGCAGSL